MQLVNLPAGKYIVAVSGGVDSMALLDMLRRQPGITLVAAHVNHGIRPDADEDEKLTRLFCMSHNIEYISKKLHLGKDTSEEAARNARYDFLQHCRIIKNATAILTAHHQDDLLETIIINLLRGTGWRGLAPFNQPHITRPLLEITKSELVAYAQSHNVPWREDATNTDQTYLRNYVRLTLIPLMTQKEATWREELLRLYRKQYDLRRTIHTELTKFTPNPAHEISRYFLIMTPPAVAYEFLQHVFKLVLHTSLVRKRAEHVLLFAKVAKTNKIMPLVPGWRVRATKRTLIVERTPTVVS